LLEDANNKQIKLRILLSLTSSAYNKHKELSFKDVSADIILMLDKIQAKLIKGNLKVSQ
jgi:hypothetical protein